MLNIIGISMVIIGVTGLFISILLAFIWRVPDILDEISGRKAKRQIKHLREINIGTGGMEAIRTNELYGIMDSGNLVWSSLESSKDSREDLEVKDTPEKVEEAKEVKYENYVVATKDKTPKLVEKGNKSDELEIELFSSGEVDESISTSELQNKKQRVNNKVIIIQEESSIFMEGR